jgi:ABC-type transporter Mla subunit MlaD
MEPELKALATVLLEGQIRTDKLISELTLAVTRHVETANTSISHTDNALGKLNEAQIRTQDAITHLAASVDKYVVAADARMKRIEENLDGLIRAITREHSNGKERH